MCRSEFVFSVSVRTIRFFGTPFCTINVVVYLYFIISVERNVTIKKIETGNSMSDVHKCTKSTLGAKNKDFRVVLSVITPPYIGRPGNSPDPYPLPLSVPVEWVRICSVEFRLKLLLVRLLTENKGREVLQDRCRRTERERKIRGTNRSVVRGPCCTY